MSDVELICEKSFSEIDTEILNRFIEFQQALIDKEFISEIMDGTLNYYRSEIIEPTVLWDDGQRATLVADVRLTAKVYGIEGKWTLNTTVDFEKIDGKWYFTKWDN